MNISVGILAGGKSTRMGKNKALLEFESETVIDRLIRKFEGHEIIISAAEPGLYERDSVKVVYDENKDIGPMEGIRRILEASSSEYVFICACDMPFIEADIADYLSGFISSDNDCYVIAEDDMIHPLCAIYSKRIIPVIDELIARGSYRLREILDNTRTKYLSLKYTVFDHKILRNINTKEEYKSLVLPVIFAVSGYKNSGKTWLIKKLINEFISDGFSVGVIKHDGHDTVVDAEGTDTYEFAKAGADVTALVTDTRYMINVKHGIAYEELIDTVKRSGPVDVIILEGFKDSPYPKIWLDQERSEDHPAKEIYNQIKDRFGL